MQLFSGYFRLGLTAKTPSNIFSTKEKQKKRKPNHWGRGCAVKVFGKNTTRNI